MLSRHVLRGSPRQSRRPQKALPAGSGGRSSAPSPVTMRTPAVVGPPLLGRNAPARRSDDALFGETLDVAAGIAEKPRQDMNVVLAVAWRAAIDGAADVRGRRAELHRQLRDRPGADLRARDLGQPFEMRELGIVIAAVLRRLADPGGNASGLQGRHACSRVLPDRPGADCRVEVVLVSETGG